MGFAVCAVGGELRAPEGDVWEEGFWGFAEVVEGGGEGLAGGFELGGEEG